MTHDPRDGDPLRPPDPEPLPVAGHQSCGWWLLWLAVGALAWIVGGIVFVKVAGS